MFKRKIKLKVCNGKNPKNQFAFTMAEILITLGILGVVIAMTLPSVIGKYQKSVTVNRLKRSYTTIAQMFLMAQKDNGSMEYWDFSNFGVVQSGAFQTVLPQIAQTYFLPYLDVLIDCGTSCQKVKNNNYKWLNNELINQFEYHLFYTIFLKDGSIIFLSVDNGYGKFENLIIYVDVNGNKGPNIVGKDVFSYYLTSDNVSKTNFWGLTGSSVKRETLINDSIRGCNKNANGDYCGALIQYDGWKISNNYPW